MYKLIRLFAPVVLSLFLCGLFAGPGWGDYIPLGVMGTGPSESELYASGPDIVSFNGVFTAEAKLVEGNNYLTKFLSMKVVVPDGFQIIDSGHFNTQDRTYKVVIKAPNRIVNKEEIVFKMRFESNGVIQHVESTYKISVKDPMQIKYGFDPSNVPPDYNGNINLAIAVETLPTYIPCGYYILGGQGFGEENTLASDTALPRILETLGFFYALTPTENQNGDKQLDSSRVAIGIGVYLVSLLFYDLPNLYKYHEDKLEIAKLKREGKVK